MRYCGTNQSANLTSTRFLGPIRTLTRFSEHSETSGGRSPRGSIDSVLLDSLLHHCCALPREMSLLHGNQCWWKRTSEKHDATPNKNTLKHKFIISKFSWVSLWKGSTGNAIVALLSLKKLQSYAGCRQNHFYFSFLCGLELFDSRSEISLGLTSFIY